MDYQKVYNDLISFRKSNPIKKSKELYTELHHIVPRCLGGTDELENLVRLTAREHFIAHRLLAKIHAGHGGIKIAVLLMYHTSPSKPRITSKEYEFLKEVFCNEAFKKRRSELSKLQWESEDFRDLMKEVCSRAGKKAWENQDFKLKMARKAKETAKQNWKNENFKHKMNSVLADNCRENWKNETHREFMSEMSRKTAKRSWSDPAVRQKLLTSRQEFFENNPWPWQRTAKRTKHVWAMAATFWELSQFNTNLTSKPLKCETFSKQFLGGKYLNIVKKMNEMFKTGWVPLECEEFVQEFGKTM